MWLALFMIVAMALLHKAGMSSGLGKSESWSTLLACVWVFLVCWGSVVGCLLVFRMESIRLAVLLSRVMRFSCLISYFVMEGCSLALVSVVDG